jgi:hypothetical protein
MENIGNGEKENLKGKLSTEEDSKTSQKTENQSTKQTKKSATPEQASEMLTSALYHCQQAGLLVTGLNQENILRISIRGLNYDGSKVIPVLDKITNVNVTAPNVNVSNVQGASA